MKNTLRIACLFIIAGFWYGCTVEPDNEPDGSLNEMAMTRSGAVDAADYYWYRGEKVRLVRNHDYVNVIADENNLKSSASLFNKLDAEQLGSVVATDDGNQIRRIVKLKIASASPAAYAEVMKKLKLDPQIQCVLPYFKRGNVAPIGTSDIFYIKLKRVGDEAMLRDVAEKQGITVIEQVRCMPEWYILSMRNSTFANSIDASNHMYETGLFDDVDPAFMFDFKPNMIPNDPKFDLMWGLRNTHMQGADINACAAWDITLGSGAIVAVVDEGIDTTHPDLNANIHHLSYDANSGTSPSIFIPGNSHGTHVAGTVAAIGNNNIHVIGVSPKAKIMGISHDLNATPTASIELADGISWAWKNGADVITNSWGDQGGAFYGDLHSAALEAAIGSAMTRGRRGLGCVVTFAAGNTSPKMDYPGTFHDDILTVGSIDVIGKRSPFSGYGAKLDVVAPGGNIVSTVPDNDVDSYSGTSMATPHAAGLAALIISVNPGLSRSDVVCIIESTARKLGVWGYVFAVQPGRPNGTRNEQLGYGLIDAYAAVLKARSMLSPN